MGTITANEDIFTEQMIQVDDYSIYMRSNARDKAQTIILVHGIGISEKYFRPFADYLAADYTVISINLPGWDKSTKPKKALNINELADILECFIQQQDIRTPVLVGQSMGCQIVARVAARRPEQISKLILLGPTINKPERSASIQLFRLLQDGLREPFALNWILTIDYLKFGVLRYIETQRYMINDKIEEFLTVCQQPTLIMRGSKDKIAPDNWVRSLRKTLKNGVVKEISGGPHNMQFTHPKELAEICSRFIERS